MLPEKISQIVEPAADRAERAKNFNLAADHALLKVQTYVDAKDQVNNWCVAQVVEQNIDDGTVRLRFEGWSLRYDVVLKKNSTKMAPFRSHTFGYTGQVKTAFRDFKLNPSYQSHLMKRINDVTESNFSCFESGYECTQFIRGELYFYVDSMLTLATVIGVDDLPAILELMSRVFELVLCWLRIVPSYRESQRETKSNSQLYCVDLACAIAMCGNELADILTKCFGGCRRASALFQKFGANYLVEGQFARADQIKKGGFMCSLVNQFGNMEGFSKILRYLSTGVDSAQSTCDEQTKMPLQLVARFLESFRYIQSYCTVLFATQFAQEASMLLKVRIENLSEREIKELEKDVPHHVINQMQIFMSLYQDQQQLAEIKENYCLALAKKYLVSPFFEKRIRGMNEFKEIFEKVQNSYKPEQQIRQQQLRYTVFLNYDNFAEWITVEGILEYIFIEKPHQELIKRSLELLFLRARSQYHPLTPDLIEAIWKCCTQKHEEITRASLEILKELVQYVGLETLELIFQHVNQTKQEEFTELHVNFLKNYTINALKNVYGTQARMQKQQQSQTSEGAKKGGQSYGKTLTNFFKTGQGSQGGKSSPRSKTIQIDSSKYLDLQQFWNIGQDSESELDQKTKNQSLNSLIEILLSNSKQSQPLMNQKSKLDFINLALDNIQQGRSIHMSIDFLKRIVSTFALESQLTQVDTRNMSAQGGRSQKQQSQEQRKLTNGSSRETLVQILLKDYSLFQEVIKCASLYQEQALAELQVLQSKVGESTLTSDTEALLTEKPWQLKLTKDYWTHEEHVSCFIDFIEFLIVNSRSSNLSFVHLQSLFEHFVTNAATSFESKRFFTFLTTENDQSRTRERKFLLDEKRRTDVFEKIMCNNVMLNIQRLNIEGFNCFKNLFLNVNNALQLVKIDSQQKTYSVNDPVKLHGMPTLWQIPILCQNENVRYYSCCFLVDLYQKTYATDSKKKQKWLEVFMKQLNVMWQQISEDKSSTLQRINWIRLIQAFITRFDYEHIKLEDPTRYRKKPNEADKDEIGVEVTLLPDNTKQIVTINANQLLWQLILQISKQFNLRPSEFLIKTTNGTVGQDIYEHKIERYDIKKLPISRIPEENLDKENPRRAIGQNSQFIQQLVQLLTEMPDEEKVVRGIIALIEILPVNKLIQKSLQQQMQEEEIEWSQFFVWDIKGSSNRPSPNTFMVLLLLHDLIVYDQPPDNISGRTMVDIEKAQAQSQLSQLFMHRGGLHYLIDMFRLLDKTLIDQKTLVNKSLTLFLKLIQHLFSPKLFPMVEKTLQEEIYQKLFWETMLIIEAFITKTVAQQANQPEGHRILKKDLVLIQLALGLFGRLVSLRPAQTIKLFFQFPNVQDLLCQTFLHIEDQTIQQKVCSTLLEVAKELDKLEQTQRPAFFFAKVILTQFVKQSLKQPTTAYCAEMYTLMVNLCQQTTVCQDLHHIQPVAQMVNDLCAMTEQRPIFEITGGIEAEDHVITGLFQILREIVQRRGEVLGQCFSEHRYLQFLLHDCLFHKETKRQLVQKGTAMHPVCKTQNSRQACLLLIKELAAVSPSGLRLFTNYLRDTIYSQDGSLSWRTPQKSNWAIQIANKHERSVTGFVGMKNIACICYMNSIMQQLYMIPAFRKAMLEVEDANSGKTDNSENVLYQIKRIFGGLMELEKQYYNPKKFCLAFKDIDGSPIDPTVQKDVDEFFNMLIDRIENLTKGTKEEKVMKNLFYGVFANEFICEGCPHYKDNEEPFMAIQLKVKNKKSVLESLDEFVEGEMLEGDNAYLCEQCDKKRDTLKRCTIKRLPNVLFLELKRFEFDFDTMSKIKVNDYCSFPMELDMQPYSQAHINREDLLKKMEKNNWRQEDLNEDQLIVLNRTIPPEYYQYKLKGVVVHDGMADYGHYYSFIRDREDADGQENWYTFNDSIVEPFDVKNLPHETFGGEHENYESRVNGLNGDPAMQQVLLSQGKTKKNNAYILIYERVCFIDQERFNEFTEDTKQVIQSTADQYAKLCATRFNQCRLPTTVSTQIQMSPTIHEDILEKNRRFWITKYIFNKDFITQLNQIFEKAPVTENSDYKRARLMNLQEAADTSNPQTDEIEILKFFVTFSYTVAFRAQHRALIPNFVKMIRNVLRKNVACSIWLLEAMSHQEMLKEFFIECPIPDMARFAAGLLKTALETVYGHEREALAYYIDQLDKGKHMQYIQKSQEKFIDDESAPPPVISGCLSPEVITLTGSTKELPMIVIFINSVLHLQTSKYYQQKSVFCAQFHQLLSHFAELGKGARLYLLKTKTLGRLLRTFLNGAIASDEPLQQLQKLVPLFNMQKNKMYLKENLLINSDAKISGKEKREVIQGIQPPNTFLVHTISLLARSCEYVKPVTPQGMSPYSVGGSHVPDADEINMLINELANRAWLTKHGSEIPVFKNSLSCMYAHISFENREFSKLYVQHIITTMAANDFQIVKRFERPLLLLVQIPDTYQPERIKNVLNSLYELAMKNTQFWSFCNALQDLTFKLSVRCPAFARQLGNNRQFLRMLEQLTKENPSFPLHQTKCMIFKDGKVNWPEIQNRQTGFKVTQGSVDSLKTYTKQRIESMLKVVNSATQEEKSVAPQGANELIIDSDSDCYDGSHKFKVGDHVDIQQVPRQIADINRSKTYPWVKGKVDMELDEMLKVVTIGLKVPKTVWIEKESPNLAFQGTHTANQKETQFEFLQKLHSEVEPFSAEQSTNGQGSTQGSRNSTRQGTGTGQGGRRQTGQGHR